MKALSYLNKYLIKYKWHLILGFIFVALSNYFSALIPGYIGSALDSVLTEVQSHKGEENAATTFNQVLRDSLLWYTLIIIGFSLLKGIFMYFMRQTIIVASRLVEYDLKKEIYTHYQKLDLAFYKKNNTGDLMSRITEDVSKVRNYLGPAILYGFNLLTTFIMVIYFMFKVNPTLAIYTLLPMPFLSISIYLVSNVINRKSTMIQRQLAALNSSAQEAYSGIRVVKSYVKEVQFGDHFRSQCDQYKDDSMDLAKTNAMFFPLMILLVALSTILVVVVGGIQVAKGQATQGNIAEFILYVNMLTWPVTAIGWIASIIQEAAASQHRINEFLQTEPSILNNGSQNKTKISGQITFENVSFRYPDSDIVGLANVSFELKAGEKLGIMGRTASGKSTIADLLLRLYDVDQGRILIDGIDIKDWDLYHLRKSIGYVPQDVFLFSDTVERNISFGRTDAALEEVQNFAEYAAIKEDIEGLPDKFQTRVGERGVTLSGGQKQRVSLARALIKEPQIIVLDDSLSAVDASTEHQILKYLNDALKDKTALIVTHRLHTMLNFDRIIVLSHGEIVEMGSHEELIALDGEYCQLVEKS